MTTVIAVLIGINLICCSDGTHDLTPDSTNNFPNRCLEECSENEICHKGSCINPGQLCRNIECTSGLYCYLGKCIINDPCKKVTCSNPNEICQSGFCMIQTEDNDNDGFDAIMDCNDNDNQIYPGAPERCNGVDDDCDTAIDETYDHDGDGFPGCGDPSSPIKDCNDDDVWISPIASERCNGIDDNCNGEVDEETLNSGAPCGFSDGACEMGINECINGALKCIGAIFPKQETCNGADDDCNTIIDDGEAASSCTPLPNATVDCVQGLCRISGCKSGWSDLNGNEADGCESPIDSYLDTCDSAWNFGALSDDGSEIEVVGTIAPEGDEDWITVYTHDSPDETCDKYHVHIEFLSNPGEKYAIEVRRGDCDTAQECSSEPITSYDFSTHFYGYGSWGTDEFRGECPCSPIPTTGRNVCTNNSANYHIRIYRTDGNTSPEQYRLAISNGKNLLL